MSFRKSLALLALVAGLVATSAATAAPARVAGGDAGPLLYPSTVNVRLVQAQKAIDRALDYQGDAQPDKAAASLKNARTAMTKAWIGATYVIEHAPPPPVAGDGGVAVVSGNPVAGAASPYASPEDTALAVLSLQHELATTALGMVDTSSGTLLTSLSTTVFAALNARDAATKYIHAIPAPPATEGSVDAGAAGGAIASSWANVMPNVVPQLDDELQMIDGTPKLSAGKQRVLNAAELQITKTEKNVNAWWPPLPVGD
jgi:hypothetical protein